ncbi:unnamed protein product [Ostreobium quekettii]|uniref:Calponin-homology (CH) domain-containing protein n=1 Tax=Ostreobium quekettii TaxID=121088 RepID=A0A8S1IQ07_9CHLO|nr:unnamed protein product [Ostreobium quekettii]|eukprot:evm.model.scf_2821.1 EVM.evm.TU.scf_2821.1   scf_2821:1893-8076(-)
MPKQSYYTGKAGLLMWVNDILELNVSSFDEFSNGAVYCQMMDAYFEDCVSMARVNFHAVKDYESFANFKIFQAALVSAELPKPMNVQGLIKGSHRDHLELLQYLYMVLSKYSTIPGYDADGRRRLTPSKGLQGKIPIPMLRQAKFDVHGRVESRKLVNNGEKGREALRGRLKTPPPRSKKASRNRPFSPGSGMRYDPNADPCPSPSEDSRSMRSPPASPEPNTKSMAIPRLELQAVPKSEGTPNQSPRAYTGATPDPNGKGSPGTDVLLSEIIPPCLKSAKQGVQAFGQAGQTLRALLEQLGTEHDTYACRAKLHSLRDAMATLMRHTSLLLDDLVAPVKKLKELGVKDGKTLEKESGHLADQLAGGKQVFQDLVIDLSTAERKHPVPRGTGESGISDQLRERTESDNLDGALRKVGAAKAALARALQKIGGFEVGGREGRGSRQLDELTVELGKELGNGVDLDEGLRAPHPERVEKVEESEAHNPQQGGYGDGGNHPGSNEVYKGQYVKNKKCGYGVYTFVNGDTYQGEFKDDEMHGYGLYTFSHEGHYEGQWVMGVYEGLGTETFALGSTYHGQYVEGSRNGWGVCRYYNGDYYEGQWREGLREGRGMQQCTDDSNFVGDYLYGKRHGYGIYNFPNGDQYYGEYVNDIPHGHGVYRFSNGQKYEGQWQGGKKHGSCVYTVETNGVWEKWAGEWEEGRPVWVESLSKWSDNLTGIPDDLRAKMDKAMEACSRAQDVGKIGKSRAEEHWQTDGRIQRAMREVVHKADKAAMLARQGQRRAMEVAARLDASEAKKKSKSAGVGRMVR